MRHLLHHVGLSVGHMHFDMPPRLIDAYRIAIQPIPLRRIGKRAHHLILGLGADIEIARIIPAADVEARNMLARLEARIGRRSLPVQVDMFMVQRCLTRIVAMGIAVPAAIGFVDRHMVHRNGEIDIVGRVPGIGIDILRDPKWCGADIAIFEHIEARLLNGAEIELQIMITQIVAPGLQRPGCHRHRRAVGVQAQQCERWPSLVVAIQFHRGDLGAIGRIAKLGMRDDRRAQPIGVGLRLHCPLQHRTGLVCGQDRSQHEPAILRLIASIIELDRLIAAHADPARGVFRCQDEAATAGHRQGFGTRPFAPPAGRITLRCHLHGACRIDREGAGSLVRHIGMVEIGRRQ